MKTVRGFLKAEQEGPVVPENDYSDVHLPFGIEFGVSSELGMPREQQDVVLARKAASDLWRHTVSQIPSVLGRMFFLASLRNANNGRYEHHGLALVFGRAESSLALKKSHREAFSEWLGYNIEQQKADLDLYLSAQSEPKRTILKSWEKLEPYANVLPSPVKDVEKRLYLVDLKAILSVLMNASGDAEDDPES